MTEHPNPLLIAVGRSLYGERWQTELARALGVSDRTVRRWVAGTEIPRPGVYADLKALCEAKAAELSKLASQIRP